METLEKPRPAHWSPGDPAVIADPYRSYAWLRENAPIWRNEFAWVVSRYDDVQAALIDPRLGTIGRDGKNSKEVSLSVPPPTGDRTRAHKAGWLMFKHGDAHKGLRRILSRGFVPSVLEELRPLTTALVHKLLDEVRQEKEFDFISRFAVPVPVTVICELFGMPEEFRPVMHDLLGPLSRTMTGVPLSAAELSAVDDAVIAFESLIRDLVVERRKRPTNDLFSALVHPARDDEDTLSDDDVVANAGVILFAGHETTVGLFGNSMLALLRHPEQRTSLRQNPGLMRNAIEELLRYEAPAQWVGRVAHEPLEIRGQRIEPDDLVWILIGSASRDPEVFDQPDKLDLAREGVRPIAFGRGPHMCLGQPLARLEAQIALPAILDALADFDLAQQEIRYKPTSTLRCPSALLLAR